MNNSLTILRPSWLGGLSAWRGLGGRAKVAAVLVGAGLFGGSVWGWRWVVMFAMSVEGLGSVVADSLLAFLFLTLGGMLVLSSLLACLNVMILSPEVGLLRTLPITTPQLYLNRSVQAGFSSGWMMSVFGPAFLLGHWLGIGGPWWGWLITSAGLVAMVMLVVNVAAVAVCLLVRVLPAHRARQLVMALSTVVVTLLVLLVRVLRPERLANPEGFESAARYLAALAGPGLWFLPSDWLFQGAMAALTGNPLEALFYVAYLWVAAALAYLAAGWVYGRVLDEAFTRAQEVSLSPTRRGGQNVVVAALMKLAPVETSLALKEGREFMRTPNQAVQLLLLGALVAVYLYNFKALGLQGGVLNLPATRDLLALLNMALAAFVLGAVAQRLFYMRHGADPKALWVLRSLPVPARRILRYEVLSAFVPLLALEAALLMASGAILGASENLRLLGALNAVVFSWLVAHLTVYCTWRWPPLQEGATLTLGGVALIGLSLALTVLTLMLQRLPLWLGIFAQPAVLGGYGVYLILLAGLTVVFCARLRRAAERLYVPV